MTACHSGCEHSTGVARKKRAVAGGTAGSLLYCQPALHPFLNKPAACDCCCCRRRLPLAIEQFEGGGRAPERTTSAGGAAFSADVAAAGGACGELGRTQTMAALPGTQGRVAGHFCAASVLVPPAVLCMLQLWAVAALCCFSCDAGMSSFA